MTFRKLCAFPFILIAIAFMAIGAGISAFAAVVDGSKPK